MSRMINFVRRTVVIGGLLLTTPQAVAQSGTAIEFHNVILDHYFLTAYPEEVAAIEAGRVGDGWHRTGAQFKVWLASELSSTSSMVPVCRFFGTDRYRADGSRIGPNSHFYTADAAECESVKTAYQSVASDGIGYPAWTFEGIAFYVALPTASACKSGQTPIYRSYNNGARGDPNHRYTPRPDVAGSMTERAWTVEGVVMCAGPGDGPPPPKAKVVGGRRHAVALRKEGTVVAWGENRDNLLGSAASNDHLAVRVPFLANVVDLYTTENHSFALREDGSLWFWGALSAAPRRIMKPGLVEAAPSDYRDISCVPPYQVLCFDGYLSLDSWDVVGRSADGRVLDAKGQAIPALAGARSILARARLSVPDYVFIAPSEAITNWASWAGPTIYGTVPGGIRLVAHEGSFYDFGVLTSDNEYWRYGYFSPLPDTVPEISPPPKTFTRKLDAVIDGAEGNNFAVALRQDGSVWTWGKNYYGQLGDGTVTDRLDAPGPVPGLAAIAVGASSSWAAFAVTPSGQVKAWGNGTYGLMGDGSTKGQLVPTTVLEMTTNAPLSLFDRTLSSTSLRTPFDTDAGFSIDMTMSTPRGNAGLRSGKINRLENAALEWVGEIKQPGSLAFVYRINSEKRGDYLRVYIDGVKRGEWSGYISTWTSVTISLAPGRHRIVWRYEKDHDTSTYADAAWVGDISMPPVGE